MGARDRLLGTAIELLRRQGVAGTGVAEIVERGHTARRSLYLNFPGGKAQLMAEATHVAGSFIDHQIASFVALPTAREALAAFVVEWKKVVGDSDYAAGCPIAAAGLSRSTEPAVADVAGDAFAQWQHTLADSLRRHGADDAVAPVLANMVLAAVEGAVLVCIARKSLTPLDDVESQLAILLDHHLTIGQLEVNPAPRGR
ncbi:TetR/AcrR family transcriptional regulator [Mycolicibacterium sediminis]|uniref:Putative TetR-family transcriptional regulator n=1 Tax=Mycolicibacterium sediminis TaxID=1286180 RepID=A0A7I7QL51_9MYCO|nr:helix-turn-helix domain-containing protein [Mycolicibacterium sediminis]BBY27099.1 putative TetR-family transcriptional regulator [Mycolicibacterium sediminis]